MHLEFIESTYCFSIVECMRNRHKPYGYYHITVTARDTRRVVQSNNERAFVVSQLQDLLSPRLLIGAVPAYMQLPSCIDLLAFSITSPSIQLLVFAIDNQVADSLIQSVITRLLQYQSDYHPSSADASKIHITTQKLIGPHQALARSVAMHLLHEDWEYDRYSSIGFYLHDRRGDWMRLWRLTKLYDGDAAQYYQLMYAGIQKDTQSLGITPQPLVS